MRGIGYTLSRLPQVRAFLAGAAIMAGSLTTAAHGQASGSGDGTGALQADGTRAEEAALSIPHALHGGGSGIALPRPLSPSDAAVVRRIFSLQQHGNIPEAVRATADLTDPLLAGSLLADRLLGRYYRATVSELTAWLDHFHDLPDAPSIHALLLQKLPHGAKAPAGPDVTILPRSIGAIQPEVVSDIARNDFPLPNAADRSVVDLARRDNISRALRLARSAGVGTPDAARLRAEVAQVLFTNNDDAGALRIVEDSLKATAAADQNSLTYYIGGLAAWRLERFDLAKRLFQAGADAAISSSRLRAACAFWASRTSRRQQNASDTVTWLKRAAEERTTFYGLLAQRILHMEIGIDPGGELLTQADIDAVAATPQGWRAFAFIQIEQFDRAEAELRCLWPTIQANQVFGRSVLLVASATGLTDLAAQLASLLQVADGDRFDEMRYPIPRFRPTGGFRIEPALVYALARTESNFDPTAVSAAGARGLMQIMPATANYVAGGGAGRLHDPAFNLDVGQRYVSYLSSLDSIDGDLIRILASYNSGPGSFLRWSSDVRHGGDPLMFIEAIPVAETRDFVTNVLAASWIYAARLHRPSPSIDSLSAGEFPVFTPMAGQGIMTVSARLH